MKRLLIIVASIVGVLIVAALLVPLFINVDSFRPKLEKSLSTALNRDVHIGKLDAPFSAAALPPRRSPSAMIRRSIKVRS